MAQHLPILSQARALSQTGPDTALYSLGHSQNQAELLATLLATVQGLQQSVDQIKEQNSSLQKELQETKMELRDARADLQTLQQNCGAKFLLFKKLPPEIRRMIWEFACLAPQIHLIFKTGASRSNVRSIVNACKESRLAALDLKLGYFVFTQAWRSHDRAAYEDPTKNFVSLDRDTLWIRNATTPYEEIHLFPDNLVWFKNEEENHWGYLPEEGSKIFRLVLEVEFWGECMDALGKNKQGERFLSFIIDYDIKELFIMADDSDSSAVQKCACFVAPSCLPIDSLAREFIYVPSTIVDWNYLEAESKSTLYNHWCDRSKKRVQEIADMREDLRLSGDYVDEEDLERKLKIRLGRKTIYDLPSWTPPIIRFKEVRTRESGLVPDTY